MRKQVAFAGVVPSLERHRDTNISLPMYAMRLCIAFCILHIIILALCVITMTLLGHYQLWREAVAGTMLLWSLPVVLLVRFAIVGLQYIVVVNESERVEHHYIRVNGDVVPRDDLHDWLIHIKLHGTTGEKAFRSVVFRSGNAASAERYRDLKEILKRADLVEERGGKAGWVLVGGPDYAAEVLGLPPLLVPGKPQK